MEALLTELGKFVIYLISSFGYAGVFFAMALESALIPLPSEIILPFTGYMVYRGDFDLWTATIVATSGNLFGAMVAYYVGVWGGRPFVERYGRYFLINERELAWTDRLFKKHGELTVLVGRLLPVVRTFISLPAGIARMNPFKMGLYTVLGALPWCLMLIVVGMKLGENWNALKPYFHQIDLFIGGLLLLGLVYWLWHHFKRRTP